MKRLLLALTLVVGVGPGSAHAAPIFFDDFNAERGGVGALNFAGFTNWDVIGPGTVDLIPLGPGDDPDGPFNLLGSAGLNQGLYVDLDGSSSAPGLFQLKNALALDPGNYTLSFFLAGNFRNWTPDVVTVNIFSPSMIYASSLITRNSFDVDIFSIAFTLGAADVIKFSFKNSGADYRGALLDDVALNAAPVPEPGSLLLLGTGTLLVARRVRRRMRSN